MIIDLFIDDLSTFGNDRELWGQDIELKLPTGEAVTGFHFDGESVILETNDHPYVAPVE